MKHVKVDSAAVAELILNTDTEDSGYLRPKRNFTCLTLSWQKDIFRELFGGSLLFEIAD